MSDEASSEDPAARSTLVVLGPRDGQLDTYAGHERLNAAGIATSLRERRIRLAPHSFNTPDHIDRGLNILHG